MRITESIKQSIELKTKLLNDEQLLKTIQLIAEDIIQTFKNDGCVLFCGNGGSAADAQHLAAEFSGRFYYDRPPLNAEALHVNTSYITAVANDYSYNEIYARLVKAKGRKADVLVGISTSGNSENIIKALEAANEKGMITVGFTGESGGKMKDICKYLINIPSNDTPRVQEVHILVGHIICELVESGIFPK
jgi:D-sedoheptulose 7-phosphate isomerase